MTTNLTFGIPDLDLPCASGTTINPSSFAGHSLIVVFLSADHEGAARELQEYRDVSQDLAHHEAWIIAFSSDGVPADDNAADRILTIPDSGRRAWMAFRDLTDCPESMDRDSGATFLFTRGGNLQHFWHGSGHADEVLRELNSPACGATNERYP